MNELDKSYTCLVCSGSMQMPKNPDFEEWLECKECSTLISIQQFLDYELIDDGVVEQELELSECQCFLCKKTTVLKKHNIRILPGQSIVNILVSCEKCNADVVFHRGCICFDS